MISGGAWRIGLLLALLGSAPAASPGACVEFLGETVIEPVLDGTQVPVGGLSGLAYDAERDLYYAISDDRSQFGPARIYELEIAVDTRGARLGAVSVRRALVLRRADGTPFPFDSIDPESLARTPAGTWIVASEGRAEKGIGAALFEFDAEGHWVGELRLPRRFRPRARAGIRNNLALESATVSPDGRWLFSATENALLQDGGAASPSQGSASRLLEFDLGRRRLEATYLYRTEPLAAAPAGSEFAVNGVVDLLALGGARLLALERSFTVGRGNAVRLFAIDVRPATDVRRVRHLERAGGIVPVVKRLVADLGGLGVTPDNVEGMALGPALADGRRTLLLVADDNFNPGAQRTQVLLLALHEEALGAAESGRGCRETLHVGAGYW